MTSARAHGHRCVMTALLSLSCASHAPSTVSLDLSAPAGDEAVFDSSSDGQVVVVAAAGDISDTSITSQQATSDLVLAGSYDAVLTLGDNQYNSGADDDFTTYFDPTWGRFKTNIFPVPGNHEYGTNTPVPAGGYFDYFFGTAPTNPRIATDGGASDPTRGYYSYDLGAWHIIALNTNLGATDDDACGVIACSAGSPQEVWLKADLAAHASTPCVLAYWHQARFTAGPHADDTDVAALWQDLYAANADVVLNGHDHNYQRFVPVDPSGNADPQRGITEFVVGTGGTHVVGATDSAPSTLAAQENPTESDNAGFGILQLTLRPGAYDYEFVGAAGTTFADKGSGVCH